MLRHHSGAELYDAEYYRSSLGPEPYDPSSPVWRQFFTGVADFIVERLRPRRVLDAGCAMGLLVEALRDRGVEAFGLDISRYALSRVREDLTPYCHAASVDEELTEDYDLITCIEVLEHVSPQRARTAAAVFARHSPMVLFSSNPRDFSEPTHINVHSTEYWLRLFARHGLHLDPSLDASAVSPQAFVVRRQRPSEDGVERAFAFAVEARLDREDTRRSEVAVQTELAHATARLAQALQELAALQGSVKESAIRETALREENRRLAEEVAARTAERRTDRDAIERERQRTAELSHALHLVQTSRAWRIVTRVRRAKVWGYQRALMLGRFATTPFRLPQRARSLYRTLGNRVWLAGATLDRDAADHVEDRVRWLGPVTIAGRECHAMVAHPPSRVSIALVVPPGSWFHVSVGLSPECWTRVTGPVEFTVEARGTGIRQVMALDPIRRISHRRWHELMVDLRPLAGQSVTLELRTDAAPGTTHAWAVWGDPVLRTEPRLGEAWIKLRTRVRTVGLKTTLTGIRNLGRSQTYDDYSEYLRLTEPDNAELDRQRHRADTLVWQPLLSVVTPVYDVPKELLSQMVDSVRAQTYPNWELCLADASPHSKLSALLRGRAAEDPRVRHLRLEQNGGISANSNEALAMAQGEYVLLLDHDDVLAPSALFEFALAINRDPSLDLVYSDRDMLDPAGTRRNPLVKPSWSPSTMLSANYLTHATLLRRRLVAEVGGLRSAYDGAQDWDLFLRMSERTTRIEHLPQVLYHWRMAPQSVASGMKNKPYAAAAQVRVVQDHLDRTARPAVVKRRPDGQLRVHWTMSHSPKVSLVLAGGMVDSRHAARRWLSDAWYPNIELLFEGSDQTSEETLGQRAGNNVRTVACPSGLTTAARKNLIARAATGEVLVFVGDYLIPMAPDWLEELVGWAMQPGIGAVGAKILDQDGKVFHAGVSLALAGSGSDRYLFRGCQSEEFGVFGSVDWYRDLMAVSGGCLAIRREVFDEAGAFDESLERGDDEVGLSLAVRDRGYRVVYTPHAVLSMTGSDGSEHQAMSGDNQHAAVSERSDPFYNPNLTTAGGRPRIRPPNPAWSESP